MLSEVTPLLVGLGADDLVFKGSPRKVLRNLNSQREACDAAAEAEVDGGGASRSEAHSGQLDQFGNQR